MSESDARRDAPATTRNRDPILAVLRRLLSFPGLVLEVSSGTGQHGAYFATALPHLEWQPSEYDPDAFDSIEAWAADARERGARILPPVRLDASAASWPVERADAIFNANMIHISPWEVGLGLLTGAARVLSPQGLLVLYGPYKIAGAHTAESNAAFDASLRGRDPRWGVRDLEDVQAAAAEAGLAFVERVPMPANNQIVVFRRED